MMVQPLTGLKSDSKDYRSKAPVGCHSDPHCDRSETPDTAQVDAQADTAQPHGTAGYDHGEFYISCGTQTIWRYKCHYPAEWFCNRYENYHIKAELGTGGFHAGDHSDRLCQCKDEQTACYYDYL